MTDPAHLAALREAARAQLRREYPALRDSLVALWLSSRSLTDARRGPLPDKDEPDA